ncbi:MAG TPA: MFS transporter [Ktedonobacteraceae bacterium]
MSESVLPSSVSEEGVASLSSTEEADLPEALRMPTLAKPLGWRLLLSLANLVILMALIPTFGILLPNQLAALDAVHKATLLALISLAGSIPALLGNLLGGALSDRTTSRFGRRRPWIIAAGLLAALALVILALAPSILIIALGVVLLQFAANTAFSCVTAIVPDQVPVTQRATVSAFASFALPLGAIIGIGVIAQAFNGGRGAYYVLAGALAVVLVVFVLLVRDPVLPRDSVPAFNGKAFLASFVRPLKVRDFSLVLVGRVFVMFGYYIVVNYLLYYLEDSVHSTATQATAQVGIFQVLLTVVMVTSTLISGVVSDRLQRRKPFVIVASAVMALSLIILAFFPVLPLVFISAAVLGIGFGVFLSGDLALQTQVLPTRRDNAKDLAILNLGSLLPQILVPLVVGITLTLLNSYPATFLVGAVLALLGAALIIPVKLVR